MQGAVELSLVPKLLEALSLLEIYRNLGRNFRNCEINKKKLNLQGKIAN